MSVNRKKRSMPDHVIRAPSTEGQPLSALFRGEFRDFPFPSSTSLRPFAPRALPRFHATMNALTPKRRFFVPIVGNERRPVRLGLSASCVWPSDHSVSNHPTSPTIALSRYPSASWASGSLRSGLRRSLAGSPPGMAESSSLALRTGRSPPVASHLASRRRSYLQLQAGERMPEKDLHLSDQTHLQTH
jgi:hypothetical protein